MIGETIRLRWIHYKINCHSVPTCRDRNRPLYLKDPKTSLPLGRQVQDDIINNGLIV